MRKLARAVRDVFAFSRDGLTLKAPFAAVPMIDSDRINKARDEVVRRSRATQHDQSQGNSDCGPDQVGAPQTA